MRTRKLFAFLLALSLFAALSLTGVFAPRAQAATTASGTCGDNLTWTLDDGVLTISGTGDMADYRYETSAWDSYLEQIFVVVIKSGVTSISGYAFNNCTNLTSVTISNSVTSIGDDAFWNCTNLKNITIPDSVTSIGNYTFANCTSLTSMEVSSGNAVYHSAGNCIIETDSKALIAGCKYSVIPTDGSVTSIGDRAFSSCTSLKSITIPDSVTSIGKYAFSGCSGLTNITIPDSVTSIGREAFVMCTSLSSVSIPTGVTSISHLTFGYCSALTSITIPDSVTSIGSHAFSSCTSLTDVYYGGSEAEWNAIDIYSGNECLTNATIHFNYTVPTDTISVSIKYWDRLENKEQSEQVNWGYSLFLKDAGNIENSDPVSFAELVKISALLSKATYDISDGGYLQQALSKMDAKDIRILVEDAADKYYPAHSISHIDFDGENTLVLVTIRGTQTTGDILTDIEAWADEDDGYSKEHPGFSSSTARVRQELEEYLTENDIDTSNAKILITGHSLGAAVGNLLADSLTDIFDRQDIFAYLFATPNTIVTTSSLRLGSNIHNFRNIWDPVTHIPQALLPTEKYTVFGQIHEFTLEDAGDASEGAVLWKNHECEHYVNYAITLYNAIVHNEYVTTSIIKQPETQNIKENETAKFTVKATGNNLKYQWQYRTSFLGTWKNSGASTANKATVKVTGKASRNGYQYRCIITDSTGNVVESETATLYVLGITTQPSNHSVKADKTAKFKVKATGDGLTYQWQYRTSETDKWKDSTASTATTATLKTTGKTSRNGYQYRCKITDSAGNTVYSDPATLTVLSTVSVTSQPGDAYITVGETAKFKVKATGNGLTYQWQYRTSAYGSWKNSGASTAKKATVKLNGTTGKNGYQYRCKITDSDGNVVYSEPATLYVLGVKTQPSSVSVSAGTSVKFTVKATGDGLTYQWQYRTSSSGSWKNSGASTATKATIKINGTTSKNGYQYRCKITDSAGNVIYSDPATLTVN